MSARAARRPGMNVEKLEDRRMFAAVTASLALYDTSGNALTPTSPGVWTIQQGTTFRVGLAGSVSAPNTTSGTRSDVALRNQPLGMQALVGDLVSSGVNIVTPVADSSSRWAGLVDQTPD